MSRLATQARAEVRQTSRNGEQLLLVLGIRSLSSAYFDMALLIALFGFVSTVALAKFLLRGEVIEP